MSDETRPGEMSTREMTRMAKVLEAIKSRENSGITIGGSGAWVSIAALLINVAALLIVGGKYMQRLEVVEKHQDHQATINREVAQHSVQIAVTQSQLQDIKESVDRIERAVTKR